MMMKDEAHHPLDQDEHREMNPWPAYVDVFSAALMMFVLLLFACYAKVPRVEKPHPVPTESSRQGKKFPVYKKGETTIIELPEKYTFPRNRYRWEDIPLDGQRSLKKEVLGIIHEKMEKENINKIEVIGHTDDIPTRDKSFTNWELSTYRALTIVHFLKNRGIPGKFLAVMGRSEYLPKVKNSSEDNRRENRRVEIHLKHETASGHAP